MWSRSIFLFLFICYSAMQCGVLAAETSEIESLAKGSGVKSSGGEDGTSSFIHLNGHDYEIFDVDKNNTTDQTFIKETINKLLTCINCMFATWARGELIKFIEFYPVIYTWKFGSPLDNIFLKKIKVIEKKIKNISSEAEKFTSILLNFFDKSTYMTYLDTSVLKSLLSIMVKMSTFELLKLLHENDKKSYEKLGIDKIVVSLVMEVVTDVQIYINANCKLSEKYDSKIFFPYLEPKPNQINMTQFLKDIKMLGLEPKEKQICDLNTIQLLNVLITPRQRNMLQGLMYMHFDLGCKSDISFMAIYTLVKSSSDLQILHWYQEIVLNSIISLLFFKIKHFFESYDFNSPNPPNVMNLFKIINSEFLSVYTNLPQKIIDSIELLASKEKYDKTDSKWFTGNNNVIADVSLKPAVKISETIVGDPKLFMDLIKISLEDFLKYFVENIADFKCFLQSFKFLNKEFNTYYMPFKKDYNKLVDSIISSDICNFNTEKQTTISKSHLLKSIFFNNFFTNHIKFTKNFSFEKKPNDLTSKQTTHITLDSDTDVNMKYNIRTEGCNFFTALVHNSVDALRYLNKVSESSAEEDLKLNHTRLNKIKTSLIKAHENYFNHRLQVTMYNVIPLVDVIINRKYEVYDISFMHRRNMSILALQLNYYGLENCIPSKHDFLTFNNIYEFGDTNYYDNVIQKYFERINCTRKLERNYLESSETHKFMEISTIYDEYAKNQDIYDQFSVTIKLKWKGEEPKTIKEIHDDILNSITQPFYYYAFVDVFLKFSFAVLFFVLDLYQRGTDQKLNYVECQHLFTIYRNIKFTEELNLFRLVFPKLTSDISKETEGIYKYLCENAKEKKSELTQIQVQIVNKFKKLGVFVNLQSNEVQESPPTKDETNEHAENNSSKCLTSTNKIRLESITFMLKTISLIAQTLKEHTSYINI